MQDRRSDAHRKALQAMRELVEAEGPLAALAIYREVAAGKTREQWTKRYGLRPTTGARSVDRLPGKRSGELRVPGEDHSSLWLHEGKPAVYVTQPYGLSWDTLRAVVGFCEANGLRADVGAAPAWHFPGAVLHVEITTPDMHRRLHEHG